MNDSEYNNACVHIINCVSEVQKEELPHFRQMVRDMAEEVEPESYEQRLRHLVGRLYDGLAYGNWPSKI